MNQIHNNLDPIQLPFFTIFDVIVFSIFLLGVMFLLWNLFVKTNQKKSPKKTKKIKKFIPPIFNIQKELKKLQTEAEKKHWKNFSLLATNILKKQCEIKFKKPFAFATGHEMEEILQEKISAKEIKNIHKFFTLLDPIKFAKSEGQEKMTKEIITILKTFK